MRSALLVLFLLHLAMPAAFQCVDGATNPRRAGVHGGSAGAGADRARVAMAARVARAADLAPGVRRYGGADGAHGLASAPVGLPPVLGGSATPRRAVMLEFNDVLVATPAFRALDSPPRAPTYDPSAIAGGLAAAA